MPLFETPAVLMAFYDPFFQSGQFKPYPWQVGIHADFAKRGDRPTEILATVPNGAGKSSQLLGPAADWTAVEFEQSQTAVTSASMPQLDLTMRSAKRLANYMNAFHQAELWDVQQRRLEFKPTGSVIDVRKSDLEGTQEGFHPMVPGGEFTILVDEGKSIPPDIYNGILKWTGFTRRMDVTSAGNPCGTFYHNWVYGNQKKWHVTFKDCPNITQADIDRIVTSSGGPQSPLAKQILNSEWASAAGSVVITLEDVTRCIRMGAQGAIVHVPADHNDAGLDLSGGGDETILNVWNGNKQLAIEAVEYQREDKIEDHIAYVLIPKYNLRMEHINGDAGGAGRPMICNIVQKVKKEHGLKYGEQMCMVYNQSPPRGILKANFANRGTQMWHHVCTLIRDCLLILLDDPRQTAQLSNRYIDQQSSSDRLILEAKKIAKANGHPSPDRADSMVLAKEDYHSEAQTPIETPKRKMTADELLCFMDDLISGQFKKSPRVGPITMEDLVGQIGAKNPLALLR